MARHVSEDRKRAAALQAGRRMIVRGERPGYRLRAGQDGSWTVDAQPWITVTATGRRESLDAARAAIAEWLDVPREAFDCRRVTARARYDDARRAGGTAPGVAS